MANFYRVGAVFLLLATLFLLCAKPANAAFPAVATKQCSVRIGNGLSSELFSTCQAAADSMKSYYAQPADAVCPYDGVTGLCRINGYDVNASVTPGPSSCPAGSTLSGQTCSCTSPKIQNATNDGCIEPPTYCESLMGKTPVGIECTGATCSYTFKAGEATAGITVSPVGRYCFAGCTVKGEIKHCGQFSANFIGTEGRGTCTITGSHFTGAECSGSDSMETTAEQSTSSGTATATPAPEPIPPGKCPGTVNGVSVLVPCGVTVDNKALDTSVKGTNTDGTTSDSSTKTNTNTVCVNGKCTTTVTVTAGTGSSTTSGTATKTVTGGESIDDACLKNPTLSGCQKSSFGGSCGAFTCTGDAVQCALSKEVHTQNCLVNAESDESALYRESKTKTGDQTGDLAGNDTVNVGASAFDQSSVFATGSCMADKTVVVASTSLTLPFSSICPYLAYLGWVLMAISFLLAARIVTRG